MARPATYLTTKVDDFLLIDLAWIRRRGTNGYIPMRGVVETP